MAQTNFTPISLYYSSTAAATPTAGNLIDGELALNTADGKLFYKDSVGVVQTIASKNANSGVFAAGTVSAPSITFVGDTNTGIYSPAADTIAFTEGGAESMRITSAGNVLVGATAVRGGVSTRMLVSSDSATNYLEIQNTSGAGASGDSDIIFSSGSTGAYGLVGYNFTDDALRFFTNSTEKMRIASDGQVTMNTGVLSVGSATASFAVLTLQSDNTSSGRVRFGDAADTNVGEIQYDHSTNAMSFRTNDVDQVFINSSGNVGIGTASPAAALDVDGNIFLNGYLRATGDGTEAIPSIQPGNDTDTGFFRPTTNVIGFTNAGSESMRIIADGTVLIGTTTDGGAGGLSIRPNNSVGAPVLNFNRNTSTSTSTVVSFRNATTAVGNINYNNTATAYVTSSDYRLKENIAPMTGALATVAQLKPVTYNWKIDGSNGQGFIAHELQAVVPECVTGEKDALDAEGNPEYQGIDTSFLVATLTAAIQELKVELDSVKAELATLKA